MYALALHGASKALYETLSEVYEPDWVGHDLIYAQSQNSDMIWTDFCHKLQDQSLAPLTSYTQDFPEIKVIKLPLYTNLVPKGIKFSKRL